MCLCHYFSGGGCDINLNNICKVNLFCSCGNVIMVPNHQLGNIINLFKTTCTGSMFFDEPKTQITN